MLRCTAVLTLIVTVACATDAPRPGELRGTRLVEPWPRPQFTLADTRGEPFTFHARTAGRVTLLFFGYTNCPDVCPVHMANLAAVLRTLPPDVSRRIQVVFVTTDPDRDTPERMRAWLDRFDSRFIGLWGPLDTVNAIQRAIGLPPAARADTATDRYLVGHAAQVIAYTADDSAHVVYPFGTRQVDWAHDLPLLTEWRR